MKRLYLIRHAEAASSGGPRGDHGRPLTEAGRDQASRLGDVLADAGVGLVVCSSAERAVQTARGLGLDAEVRPQDELYNSSTTTIARVVAALPAEVDAAALVAHAPGVPAVVDELTGADADPDAVAFLDRGFGTATLAAFEIDGGWADLDRARLVRATRG